MASVADYERFDERSLVEAARRDANAFAVLYRRHVDRIHAYAYRRTQSVALAEDVTAATFEKALRGLGRYRWREPGISPWLFRIASNELVDRHRRNDRDRRTHDELRAVGFAAIADASEGVVGDWLDAEVRDALGAISDRYQRALSLRFLADLSNEEVAAAMGVSRATMAVVVHRALAALRKELARRGVGLEFDASAPGGAQ